MAAKAKQYTIRDVPARVDRVLRAKAAARKLSLNSLVVKVLEAEAGVSGARENHDLDDFFGSWQRDAKVDRALAEQRRVDRRDWR